MTPERWLEAHAYLRPLAELSARVDEALLGVEVAGAALPDLDAYRGEYRAGVPLLVSAEAAVDLEPAGRAALALVERLAGEPADGLAAEARALADELSRRPGAARRVADFLMGDESLRPPSAGLMRFLGWRAAAHSLRPVVAAFDRGRDDGAWRRRYCPTCGSLPAMAQLAGVDSARVRRLACGRCGTRWEFGRTACPFCEADSQRLAGVTIEGEPALRIDHCEGCRGYLKTYLGQGDEGLLLADWSSLHLDLIAQDRGLERRAVSLYDFEPVPAS
jgi:FdhE protein